ncbi:MAG: hypothetical protein ACREFE_12995, partial [Limisphaerales bacterium]
MENHEIISVISLPHGNIVRRKILRANNSVMDEIKSKYENWRKNLLSLNSEKPDELREKVELLNEYKNFIDGFYEDGLFKMQEKMSSSIIEEFMYYLLKDLPKVAAFGEGSKIVLGQT